MALQGTLTDFALPDVLSLLSSTKKTGELRVRGDSGDGRVWLEDGQVVGADAGVVGEPIDTLFELLRFGDGSFTFTADIEAPEAGARAPLAVEPLLAEAQARLAEWRSIEAVVPSLSTPAHMATEPPSSPVVIEGDHWRVLVAVANGGTVHAVANAMELSEFNACKIVKELVDAGLVTVAAPGGGRGRAASGPHAMDLDSLVEIPARRRRKPAAPEAEEEKPDDTPAPARAHALARQLASLNAEDGEDIGPVTPEEAAALEDAGLVDENGEPINRSLLLKFLSSVRS